MNIRNILAGIGGSCLLAFGLSTVQAATYQGDVAFQADDQSMWQQGTAGQLVINEFIGPQWSFDPPPVGGIASAVIPEATIIPEVCAWGVCTPALTTPEIDFGDYGATLDGETNGRIGFDLDVQATTGDVDIVYPGTVNFEYPDQGDLVPGVGLLTIDSAFAEGATSLMTNFPEASMDLDFVFDVYANAGVKVCVAFCGEIDVGFDIDERLDLIDIDTNTAELNFDLGFVNIGAQLPNLETQDTTLDGAGNLVASGVGENPLIDLDIDLDLIATTLLGLPALTQTISLLGASATFTLLDVLVGAEVQVVQTFTFDPTLMVRLDASDGQSIEGRVGDDLVFNTFGGGETTVTPTFWLENSFRNTTALRIDPTFDLELLSAQFIVDMPDIPLVDIPDINIPFGPLVNINESVAGPAVNVFNRSWMIPFDDVQTESFVVVIPEPGTLVLFGIGLVMLGASGNLARRRREDELSLAA